MTKQEILEGSRKIHGWLREGNHREDEIIYDLAQQYIQPGGKMAEVGVWKGKSAYIWASVCKEKKAKLYAVDVFTGGIDLFGIAKGSGNENLNDVHDVWEAVHSNLHGLPVQYIRQKSHSGWMALPDGLDIVFIDGDHSYDQVKQDIQLYRPLVREGGLLCGHDYATGNEVSQAVDELIPGVQLRNTIWFHEHRR